MSDRYLTKTGLVLLVLDFVAHIVVIVAITRLYKEHFAKYGYEWEKAVKELTKTHPYAGWTFRLSLFPVELVPLFYFGSTPMPEAAKRVALEALRFVQQLLT